MSLDPIWDSSDEDDEGSPYIYGAFKSSESISESDLEYIKRGVPLFGPDGEVVGILDDYGVDEEGHLKVNLSMMKDSEKFLRWIIEFDLELKIRGINID